MTFLPLYRSRYNVFDRSFYLCYKKHASFLRVENLFSYEEKKMPLKTI
jgi:hypothetical protein